MNYPLLNNYSIPAIDFVKGQGSYVWDSNGKKYLDFSSGIAVNNLGHCHPAWVKAISEQAQTLVHCSNLYGIPVQRKLAQSLIDKIGPGKLFFCNSGTEANEALLKFSRLFGKGESTHVVCAEEAFHGRTFGSMSATPQAKIQNGFKPLLDNFSFAPLNDIEAWKALVTGKTTAVLLEPIQGETGINVAEVSFLKELKAHCESTNTLFLLDEVQTGIGRTGTFLAHEPSGVIPDGVALAKGLGNGFPIGAIWINEKHVDLFTPGCHGSTFGGSPMASTAALTTLQVIDDENLLKAVNERSKPWINKLNNLADTHSTKIKAIKGVGYLIGIAMHSDITKTIASLTEAGLITVPSANNVIRLLPPLNASNDELNESIRIINTILEKTTS